MTDWDVAAAVRAAEALLRGRVRQTPLEPSPWLGQLGRCRVHLKLENQQRTGSFKLRGACHKLLALPATARRRGVVAASSGNHGAGVAEAARELGVPATVFVPVTTSAAKVDAIVGRGAQVVQSGDDCAATEAEAREYARLRGLPYVSPYDDRDVIAGQGTLGAELARQVPRLDAVFLALGGGGLAAGVAGYLKSVWPGVEIVACSPASSAVMHHSMAAGTVVAPPIAPTLSDGTAGGIDPDTITLPLCRRLIDRSLLVGEDAIAWALRAVLEHHHTLIEGAAAVAVAGFVQRASALAGREVAIVLCGANIDAATLRAVLEQTERPALAGDPLRDSRSGSR